MVRSGISAVLCLALIAIGGRAEEKAPDVEGKWQREAKDNDDNPVRIVKEHKAGRTTLTIYNDKGEVLHEHTSEYKLKKTAEVRILTFTNLEVTAGPNKGMKRAGTLSYAYRIEGDTFYEFQGVLIGSPPSPRLVEWKRVKE